MEYRRGPIPQVWPNRPPLARPAVARSAGPPHHDPIRRKELELPTRFDHMPSAFMHQAMVEVAEQDHVGQIVWPASRPGNDVMRIRPVDLAIAAGEPAALISNPQRPPHRRPNTARRPPDVD